MFKIILQIMPLFLGSALMSAQAATLSIDPSSQSIDAGNTASVDVVISDLGLDIVSAYDLDISFDSSILSFSSITINGDSFGSAFSGFDSNLGGVINFNLASFELDSALELIQGDSFTIATLGFDTLVAGTSILGFSFIDVTGANGQALFPSSENGSIIVKSTTVPEPSTMMLLAMGAVGFFTVNRKKVV